MNTDQFHIPEELLTRGEMMREEHLLHRLDAELARCARSGSRVSIVVVADPAHGDVASHLSNTLRPYDVVAQGAGGQFLVLLPDTPAKGCEQFVRRIDQQLAQASLGWATSSQEQIDAAELLGAARSVLHFNQQLSDVGSNMLLAVDPYDESSVVEDLSDSVETELR